MWGSPDRVAEISREEIERHHQYSYIHAMQYVRVDLPAVLPVVYLPIDPYVEQAKALPPDERRGAPHVELIKRLIENGAPLPPVFIVDGVLKDGRHRVLAAADLALREIPAVTFSGH